MSIKSRGLYEFKRHFQREHHLRADQRFRARYYPSKVRDADGRTLYGSKLEAEKELFMHLEVPELDNSIMTLLKENPLPLPRQVREP